MSSMEAESRLGGTPTSVCVRKVPTVVKEEWQCDEKGFAAGLRTPTDDGQVFRTGWWKD